MSAELTYPHWPTIDLLDMFVWGEQPENCLQLIQELRKRDIDLEALRGEVWTLIRKYAGV